MKKDFKMEPAKLNVEASKPLQAPSERLGERQGRETAHRFTVDLPEHLHAVMKLSCAGRVPINSEVNELLEAYFRGGRQPAPATLQQAEMIDLIRERQLRPHKAKTDRGVPDGVSRTTFTIPRSLYEEIARFCAKRGKAIGVEVREILMRHYLGPGSV